MIIPSFAEAPQHLVQFSDSGESTLCRNVARFAATGLKGGSGFVAFTNEARHAALSEAIADEGVNVGDALASGRIAFADAASTIEKIIVDGMPGRSLIDRVVGSVVRNAAAASPSGNVRAYGDMVGMLWSQGRQATAVALEHAWNRLQGSMGFDLYCAYPIDVTSKAFHEDAIGGVLASHTHVVSSSEGTDFHDAIERAMGEVFGARAPGLRKLMKVDYRPSWGELPATESAILWLRANVPESADEIIARATKYLR